MSLLQRFFQLIAPHRCLLCNTEGSLLCDICKLEACPAVPDRCYRCYRISPSSAVCASCRRTSSLTHVWVATEYEQTAKRLLYLFKFERAQDAAGFIVPYLSDALPYLEKPTLVAHVPSASSRVRQRGYDHARLLAKHLARDQGLWHRTLLTRVDQTRQVGAKRSVRLKQLAQSFRPLKPEVIKGARILLVDDVVTTGGTLEAAASILKQAGARRVDAIVFAAKQ